MEGFVAKQVHDYQNGKISRRRLIEILTFAATTVYAQKSAGAAEQPGLDAALVNHISYTCPDFRKAADWYSMVFNLDQVGATARDVALPFGKAGEKPYGVSADDVPLTHIICRTRPPDAPAANAPPRRAANATIDHIAYTVARFRPRAGQSAADRHGCQ
jgi:catechol 2,3-dioxygenase-like lactoylglutathione lyase family enzyme